MGKVSEYDGLGLVDVNDTIRVMGCEVNRCTELSVSAVAVTYGVRRSGRTWREKPMKGRADHG